MNPFVHHRDAGPQKAFHVSSTDSSSRSHHTKCKRFEVQHATTIITPHKRPRPGRRRLSLHNLPLSSSRIVLFVIMIISVLCMQTEAADHPGLHGRALQGHFVDGRIQFDHDFAPQPALHRRDDPVSTDTASTTTAAEVAVTSSSSDSPTTTTSLPRAFDAGFGTNYTQPSCPTFLRSMVSNATFISCAPFSLLLQVRHLLSQEAPPSEPFLKTNLPSAELNVLLRRDALRLQHNRCPRRILLCRFPHLFSPHVLLRRHPPLLHRLPRRLQQRKP